MNNRHRQVLLHVHIPDHPVDEPDCPESPIDQKAQATTADIASSPGESSRSDLLLSLDDRSLSAFILEPRVRPAGSRLAGKARDAALRFFPPVGRFCRVKRAVHRSLAILAEEGAFRLGIRSTGKVARIVQRSLGFGPEARKVKAARERVKLVHSIGELADERRRTGEAGRSRVEVAHLIEHRCQTCRDFSGSACVLMKKHLWRSSGKAFQKAVANPAGLCPKGNWPDPQAPRVTRLNLVYFIFPMRHPDRVWQWNVAELLKRIEHFNGRRIITVAVDGTGAAKCGKPVDPPEAVVAAFAGHDVEFRFVANDPRRGEAPHFLPAMREIASTNPSEAVFYAHAKGVSRLQYASAVRAWTAAMYHHNLDRIDEVADLLGRWPCAGIAKWYGFPEAFLMGKTRKTYSEAGRPWHGWHFAGTYWWVRHDALFSRPDWEQIEIYNYATEKYLANFFRADEAFCLAYDNCEAPYELATWKPQVDQFDPAAYALRGRELNAA